MGPALPPLNGGKTYTDPQGRFSFSVPQDWDQASETTAEVAFTQRGNTVAMNVGLIDVPARGLTIDDFNAALRGSWAGAPSTSRSASRRSLSTAARPTSGSRK